MINQTGRLYIKNVEKLLDCPYKHKKNAREDIIGIVEMYLRDNPYASYGDMVDMLGSPEDMAAEWMKDIPEGERCRTYRKWKRFYTAVAAVLLIVAVGTSSAVVHFIRHPYTDEITTVVDYTKNFPSYWDYAEKYGINYEYDSSGVIIRATDNQRNEIAVDQEGIPLDKEKYFIEEKQ
ncbi:MAG: hypothetical protein Q4C40_04590 [Eubacteriales bacterium]|nr:hypothetical protein [Eubacteriales bacterium]